MKESYQFIFDNREVIGITINVIVAIGLIYFHFRLHKVKHQKKEIQAVLDCVKEVADFHVEALRLSLERERSLSACVKNQDDLVSKANNLKECAEGKLRKYEVKLVAWNYTIEILKTHGGNVKEIFDLVADSLKK